ncbi:MAG: M56 family metallopeptidase [Planctomycetota bacterium]|jgi:beta-lactamase regulating signal transducer with metallopeptidase domain
MIAPLDTSLLDTTGLPALVWIGRGLFYGTLLAGVTWLITRMFRRRLPASFHAALWCLVLLKFMTPIGPNWSHSFTGLVRQILEVTPARLAIEEGAAHTGLIMSGTRSAGVENDAAAAAGATSFSWLTAVLSFYGLFVFFILARGVRAYRNFRRGCEDLPRAGDTAAAVVAATCHRLGVGRVPACHVSHEPGAPFVVGWFRPILVLAPQHIDSPRHLETVVLHEVAHLRRGDFLVRYLQWFAGTLLFFWPVVRWVNRQIDLARECACDEWALRQGKLSAGEYARCLLDAARCRATRSAAYHPACMAANPATIERRIDMILESTQRTRDGSRWGVLAMGAVLAWGGFVLADGERVENKTTERAALVELEIQELDFGKSGEPGELVLLTRVENEQDPVFTQVSAYSQADVDGNGHLSGKEMEAFLLAKMQLDTEAVLHAYPGADTDLDEELSFEELHAFLFVVPMHHRGAVLLTAESIEVELEEIEEGENSKKVILQPIKVTNIEAANVQFGTLERDGEEGEGAIMAVTVTLDESAPNAQHGFQQFHNRRWWILENIEATPTARQVGRAFADAWALMELTYIRQHPEADSDNDGRLSIEEYDASEASLRSVRFGSDTR